MSPEPRGPLIAGLAVGVPLIGFGLYQVVSRNIDPVAFATWLAGGVVLHDFLLVPLVFAAGGLVRRRLTGRGRAPVQAALIGSGIIVLFALPALSGKGATAGDPSRLPGDYPAAVAGLVLGIWLAAAVWLLAAGRRRGT